MLKHNSGGLNTLINGYQASLRCVRLVDVKPHERFRGVFWIKDDERMLATRSLAPGIQVYGERLFKVGGEEYRSWIPYRSKLAAAILNNIKEIFIRPGSRVLYLGVATGTTASHVSDIIGREGILYGVDFAPRVMIQFKRNVADRRPNIVAIYGDARRPGVYAGVVGEVDVIYCDVAQPEQARILVDNASLMLRRGGHGLIAIKSRSIDSVEEPEVIYRREVDILERGGFKVLETVNLEPYERDHILVAAEFKG